MKRIVCAVLAAGLLAAGPLAGRARAEEDAKDGGGRGERAGKMMQEKLGLTDEQAAKLKDAWKAEKEAMKPLREEAKKLRRKLEEQVRDLASNKDIEATLDRLDAGRKSMMAEREKLESALAAALKPDQRARMRLMMVGRMKHGRHGKRGGRDDWKGHRDGNGRDGHWGDKDRDGESRRRDDD